MNDLRNWIGLAEVHSTAGSDVLGPARKGAIVTIIAHARDANDFRVVAAEAFREYGFELVALDNIELLSERTQHSAVDEILLRDAKRIPQDTKFVFGNFHTYPLD